MTTTIHTHNDTDSETDTWGSTLDTDPVPAVPYRPDNYTTRYVFFDEGGLHVGTLRDYAKAWEDSHYSGFYLSPEVRSWYATYHVQVRYVGTDDNDYLHYRLTANDETAYAVIDGRA